MTSDPYYYDLETEDGELMTFEAAETVDGEEHFTEGRPLAECEMPRRVTPSMYNPEGLGDCYNPAIARICWTTGSETKVCREHYEKVRLDYKRAAEEERGGEDA